MSTAKIIYTITDEAPALATYSLLPIVQGFTRAAGVAVETRDISLAGRILAAFPDSLSPGQRQTDDLAELGALAKTPEANIISCPTSARRCRSSRRRSRSCSSRAIPCPTIRKT